MSARFDDVLAGTAWVFHSPRRVLTARSLDEVTDLLAEVDRATRGGAWAWGYVSYEAAPAFDTALRVRPPDGLPLARFALGSAPAIERCIDAPQNPLPGHWRLGWTAADHADRVRRIRESIADGDAYQVNLTNHLYKESTADPMELYAALVHAQRGSYNAFLDFGDHVIASASPELFFRWDDRGLTVRPMKGTAPRGATNEEDALALATLTASAKERAENVMIVDLMRNDLSRVAEVGSVRVQSLLEAERYETVWQLTSTITAEPRPGTTLADVFAALFPCGSVTGAPKAAAMGLIARLESQPRGPYCGAIGMVAPPGAPFRCRFSVGIRTAVIDRTSGTASYGAGGAITWDSDASAEYRELRTKAAVLDQPAVDFQLLETLRFEPGSGLRNLDRHLRRLLDSAAYFGFRADRDDLNRRIQCAVAGLPTEPRRVRMLLARDGTLTVEHAAMPAAGEPVALAVDTAVTTTGRWTRHKTTRRDQYEAAAERHPDADDVILLDSEGQILETTRANLAVKIDGRWCTPPLSSGCLPGIERQLLIDSGDLIERAISASELPSFQDIAVVSSLRGLRQARLRDEPDRPGDRGIDAGPD